MRFLVDESTGRKVNLFLKAAGHDSLFVGDFIPGSPDDDVLAYAEREDRILITDDKDFGQLVFRLRKPTSGVILLRVSEADAEKKFRVLEDVTKTLDPRGKFITIREGRSKVRNIE